MFAPDSIPTVTPEAPASAEANKKQPEVTGRRRKSYGKTHEELRKEYPEQIAQAETEARASADHTEAVNAAVHAERTRMRRSTRWHACSTPLLCARQSTATSPAAAAELVMADARKRAKQGREVHGRSER